MNRKTAYVEFPDRLFITGTDTGVGKTLVAAILMAGLEGAYWKPVQSGLEEITDTEWVRNRTGLPETRFFPETYRLRLPLSPHASAAHDGVRIDLDAFQIPRADKADHLIIEGAGGILVPLNEHCFMADLMEKIGAPILLVSPTKLGTINHTLLSIAELRKRGLEILGIIMNGEKNQSNREAIEHYGKVRVLAEVEPLPVIDPGSLKRCFEDLFMGPLPRAGL